MARIALGLEYDGTDFVGLQSQRNGRSVQDELTRAIAAVADHAVSITAAGRTDRGVHAAMQVVHFDSEAQRSERQWVLGINSNLPADVAVQWARAVPEDFDARRSALYRRYRYRLLERPTRPALARRAAWWLREPVDCARITRAAAALLGEHDFSAFRAAGCQSLSPMRRLISVCVARDGARVTLDFTANAFLQQMVRNLVGTLVEIGQGRQPPVWAAQLLDGRDRRPAAATAPAHGLTLVEVAYPARFELPPTSAEPPV
jgi:tRNA pseudouridine38-40 synthase